MDIGTTRRRGFIRCFGLFWSADEVNWEPGTGNLGAFRLLGRVGQNRPTVAVCDFQAAEGHLCSVRRLRPLLRGRGIGHGPWTGGAMPKRNGKRPPRHFASSWRRESFSSHTTHAQAALPGLCLEAPSV